jgi:hypothetical protein
MLTANSSSSSSGSGSSSSSVSALLTELVALREGSSASNMQC